MPTVQWRTPIYGALLGFMTALSVKAADYSYQSSLPPNSPPDGVYDLIFKLTAKSSASVSPHVSTNIQQVITNGGIRATLRFPQSLTPGGVYSLDIARRPTLTNTYPTIVTNQEVVIDRLGNIQNVSHNPWGAFERIRKGTFVDAIFYLIGIICMVVYTVEQFNTPPTNRSTTTPIRYKTALLAYVTFGLTVYLLLTSFPELLATVMRMEPKELPSWLNGLATPLFVALLLTSFLPKVQFLNSADEQVRKKLWKMAAIPSEAEDLSDDLQLAEFNPPDEVRKKLEASLEGKGFDRQDFAWQADVKLKLRSEFTRVAVLMEALKRWQTEKTFKFFFRYYNYERTELEERYKALCSQAGACFLLQRTNPRGTDADLEHLTKECEVACGKFSKDVFKFVSRALLLSEPSEEERYKRAAEFGFSLHGKAPAVPLQQIMFLFLVISIIVMVGLVLSQEFLQVASSRPRYGVGQLLEKAAMISAIYCLSAICAIYPKDAWPQTKAKGTDWIKNGAWGYYAIFALTAAIISVCFSAIWQFAFSFGSSAKFIEALTQKYPYGLVAFVTTFLTGFCADFTIGSKANHSQHVGVSFVIRYPLRTAQLEAAIQVIAGLVVAWVVSVWLGQSMKTQLPPPLPVLMLVFATVGGLIGYFVPSWYRQGQADRAFHRARVSVAKQAESDKDRGQGEVQTPPNTPAVDSARAEAKGKSEKQQEDLRSWLRDGRQQKD